MAGLVLRRWCGLGDVAMVLVVAQVLKKITGERIVVQTMNVFHDFVRACPFVDLVIGQDPLPEDTRLIDLGSVAHAISEEHLVDAFLRTCGWAYTGEKTLVLNIPATDVSTLPLSNRRILLFPGSGDPNRTMPMSTWNIVASSLITAGYEVCTIGRNDSIWKNPPIQVDGVIDLRNSASALGMVSLMQRSALLVSCDTGPIQLAGASDIGIVGIYGAVAGKNRLPWRHGMAGWNAIAIEPSCPMFPCYPKMNDPALWAQAQLDVNGIPRKLDQIVSQWCPANSEYICMQNNAEMIIAACLRSVV